MALLVAGYLTAALVKHTTMAHRPRRHGWPHLSPRHRRRPL